MSLCVTQVRRTHTNCPVFGSSFRIRQHKQVCRACAIEKQDDSRVTSTPPT
ncbi:hypothetical protein X777_14377 [Ooceraea biroi]|uniref:Uncharacterized protein n=1 Tax=Ooceraea biroi TaxID=2015173 RepID=A0A026WUT0_OOCBI|nr:hypothetical protein X777_14377 [Ooceraea biroi]